jgi:glycine/D-amino acid oxidase-like deaminating enzyme
MAPFQDAEIVIIGGGAVGCAVAYSLAQAGKHDILLIEKEPALAAVTTSQAAGLVGQVRNTIERVTLAMWSVRTFRELEENTESRPAWREVGSLRVALCDERVQEFLEMRDVAKEAGLEVQFLDTREAQTHWPAMCFDQSKAVLWCPTDGYLQPYDLTMAYCSAARRLGVRFQTGARVEQIIVRGGRVTGVVTDHGTLRCEVVVNAAGAHAYHVAKAVGIDLPIVPVRHEFFVTVPAEGLHPNLPVVRIPDATLYLRAEVSALLVGGWEPHGLSTDPCSFPLGGEPPLVKEDWDVLAEFGARLAPHIPLVNQLGIRRVFKGWPTFTPDGRFIVGESCRLKGFVMAGGCNAHGVSGSAGIGRHVVESMLDPAPSPYVRSLSPDRFTESHWDWDTARRRAQRVYESYYALHH